MIEWNKMQKPRFTISTLTLRLAEQSDTANIIEFYLQNESHLKEWEPERPLDFFSEAYWQKQILKHQMDFSKEESLRLGMFETQSNTCVGFINYTNIERGPFQNCRLGYKISKSHQGQGLMYESLKITNQHMFNHYNLHRIEANVIPSNTRSLNLLRRLGFVEHGIAKNYLHINCAWRDHVLTSLVKEA